MTSETRVVIGKAREAPNVAVIWRSLVGPTTVDLVRDRPHGFVAGTAG
ncbi:MAG TPA: hypothetical protein VFN61_02300 [Acidimicrobiales bacterium]|nr:hypothetical protein [Acidimicrobiales bacterium]